MKLTREEAQAIVYSDDSDWQCINKEIVKTTRWSILKKEVHEHLPTGKFYEFHYSVGATEIQNERAYEYDTEVEPVEVEQIEKIVMVWEKVK